MRHFGVPIWSKGNRRNSSSCWYEKKKPCRQDLVGVPERCIKVCSSQSTQQGITNLIAACISRARRFPWRTNQDLIAEHASIVQLVGYLAHIAPRETVRFTSIALVAMISDIEANDLVVLENSAALISLLQSVLPRCTDVPSEFGELCQMVFAIADDWPLIATRIVELQVRHATSHTLTSPLPLCAPPLAASR